MTTGRPEASGRTERAGRLGLAAMGLSAALTFTVAAAGTSVMEPALPGLPGQPPWAFSAHLSGYLAVGMAGAALALGAAGLALALRAARGGWLVPARTVLIAGLLAAAAVTLVPPFGSSDQLSYAAYGRMLVTGHDPYTTTAAQLAALGDPVARAVQDWFTTPSVYGPLATGIQGLASLVGATSARLTVFVLDLANLAAFAGTAAALDHMTRGDPGRRLRAALLWTANPLLLQLLVAGAHVDLQAAAFAVCAVAVMYGAPATGRAPSSAPGPAPSPTQARAALAGVLAGLGAAVKVSDVLVAVGLAVALVLRPWPSRRRLAPLASLAAGFAATAAMATGIGGPAMLRQLSRESDLVSIGSPWRVIRAIIQAAGAGTAATDVVKAGAAALAVTLAVLLIRGLLPVTTTWLPQRRAPDDMVAATTRCAVGWDAGAVVAFALVVAWLFAWPYVLPWYDALAWALLPLVPVGTAIGKVTAAEGTCWLLLGRTTALGLGYLPAREADVALPRGLSWLELVIRHGVTPAVLAAATAWLVMLMVRSGRAMRSAPPPGTTDLTPAGVNAP